MGFRNFVFMATLFSFSGTIVATQQQVPENALLALHKSYPSYEIGSSVAGELLGDKSAVVAYLFREEKLGFWPREKIVVIANFGNGGYQMVAESQERTYNQKDESWLEIKQGSLFVHIPSGGMQISTARTFQLRFDNGEFILIGDEYKSFYHGNDTESELADNAEFRISTNYLTGREILYNANGIRENRKESRKITLETLFPAFYGEESSDYRSVELDADLRRKSHEPSHP